MNLPPIFSQLAERIRALSAGAVLKLPELLAALIVALLALSVAGRLSTLIQNVIRRARGPASMGRLLGRAVYFAVLLLGAIIVLSMLGLNEVVLGFVSSLGVAALILGFALQDITRQVASGVLLLTLRPFDVGDEIGVGDFEGTVVDVKLLTTVLRTDDGREVLIPNADVYTSPIVNRSRYGVRRLSVTVELPPGADLHAARERLLAQLRTLPEIAENPGPELVWGDREGETLKGEARFWVDARAHDTEAARSAAVEALNRETPGE
jgi:small-conductance mechanosensitive channel